MEISNGSFSMGSEFDVFLSFRGPDTRNRFADHLYECMSGAGLRVFRDDEGIHRGEGIESELKLAIHSSRVYAIVFSRNYASSPWCLRELALMVDLRKDSAAGTKIILPIFYGADPRDVKLRTELYRKALDNHKGQYTHEVVKKWEEALITVGRISGWDSKAIRGEGRFVRLIVQDIIGKLRITDRSLPVHLTGINGRESEMVNLLNCVSSDVRVVVMYGMGGIGKTTLASVVYNKISSLFEGSSFLSDVRESSTGDGGKTKLKHKLLTDIFGVQHAGSCNFDIEVNEVIIRLRGKRLLLILDDVDETSQLKKLVGNHLEWLGSGSRIIITTRNRSVCNGFIGPKELHFYEMGKMNDDHALKLFCRHAFGNDEPPEDYVTLSKQVVSATGNLPLALEMIGCHLCCEEKESWKSILEELKQVPPKEVLKILMISYEGLDFREREIFLDIACFLEQMPRTYADQLWEARNLYPKCGVTVLVNKSLIKILPDGQFWIHDQLRDMGKEIIRSEGLGSPGKYTRLWIPEDSLNVLNRKETFALPFYKDTEKILAINLGRHSEGRRFTAEDFRGFSNLLYLQLTGGKFIGDFENLRARLMWLSWDDCPQQLNSTIFKMSNLVVLRISGIRAGYFCVGKLIMPNLKVLEIYNSLLTSTPDLSVCLKLEIIIFRFCDKLQAIHDSIGKLENLTFLNIFACQSLTSLTKEIGCGRALRELTVTFTSIKKVPESIGRLESLTALVLQANNIRKIPASVSYLKNLKELDASFCPLDEGIAEEIGGLSALVNLNLEGSKLRRLPATISQLSRLKSLNLDGCNMLQELPELPASLTQLTFSSSSLRVVPSLYALTNLNKLILCDGCSPRNDYVVQTRRSHHLELSWLGKLHKLKSLHLCLWGITALLTTELGSLSRLEELHLSCPDMASVSRLPSSLFTLTLSCSRTTIPWACYSNLKVLGKLELRYLRLTDIHLSGLDLLGSLKTLNIMHCESLLKLSSLGRMRLLTSLSLECCPLLVEIPGLEQLEMLERLCIHSCGSIQSVPDLLDLRRLNRVDISDCSSLLSAPRVFRECNLKIFDCPKLPSFEGPYRQYELQMRTKDGGRRAY